MTKELSAIQRLFGPRVAYGTSAADKAVVLGEHRRLQAETERLTDDQLRAAVRTAQVLGDEQRLMAVAYVAMSRGILDVVSDVHDALGAPQQELWDAAWSEAIGEGEDPIMADLRSTFAAVNKAAESEDGPALNSPTLDGQVEQAMTEGAA